MVIFTVEHACVSCLGHLFTVLFLRGPYSHCFYSFGCFSAVFVLSRFFMSFGVWTGMCSLLFFILGLWDFGSADGAFCCPNFTVCLGNLVTGLLYGAFYRFLFCVCRRTSDILTIVCLALIANFGLLLFILILNFRYLSALILAWNCVNCVLAFP